MIELRFLYSKEVYLPKRVIALPYANIFDEIIENFEKRLETFFGNLYSSNMKVVVGSNEDALYDVAAKTNQDKIGFPFFGVRLGNIEPRNEFNTWLLRQSGISFRNSNGEFFQFQLLAININITINFFCLDQKDLRLYAQRWIDAAFMHYLNFELDINGIPLVIRVDTDTSFNYPEIQNNGDTGTMFDAESTGVIHGYLGSVTPISPIKQFNTKIYDIVEVEGKYEKLLLKSDTLSAKSSVNTKQSTFGSI